MAFLPDLLSFGIHLFTAPTLKAARSNRVGHATKDLLRRWAGQIFYCTHRVQDLNVVHIGGEAACSALLPPFALQEQRRIVSGTPRRRGRRIVRDDAFVFWEKHRALSKCRRSPSPSRLLSAIHFVTKEDRALPAHRLVCLQARSRRLRCAANRLRACRKCVLSIRDFSETGSPFLYAATGLFCAGRP